MTKKKRELPPDRYAECITAHELFLSKKKELGLSQRKIAEELGISTPAVNLYFKGENPLNANFAAVLSRLLKEPVEKFSPRLAKEMESIASAVEQFKDKESNVIAADFSRKDQGNGFIQIPQLDVKASMGLGAERPEHDILVDTMTVSVEFLKQQRISYSEPGQLALITGYGDSMEGTFSDGDVLLVDRTIDSVKIDAVYVLALNDELYIKRLQRRGDGGYLMISDNTKYQPITIEGKDLKRFQVLGRVVMAWNAKRM